MRESTTLGTGRADPVSSRQLEHRHRARLLARPIPARVWVVLAIALALRLTVVGLTFETPATLDPADFNRTALSIAQGDGYPSSNRAPGGGPSAFRPPGYPAFLAGVYAIGGEAPPVGRLGDVLMGTLTVALIGGIATRVWGRRVGDLALGVAAVAPPLVIMSTALVSEALFVPLVLAAVWAAIETRRSNKPVGWAVVTGVLVGLAGLTRTNGLILLVPLSLAVALARSGRGLRRLTAPMALLVAALLTIAPWTARNWVVLHRFVPVSTEIGYTLAGTYNEASRADQHWPAVWKEAEHGASPEYGAILFEAEVHRWNEVTYGEHLQAAAIADIAHDPVYLLKVGFWNFIRMFHLGELDFALANLRNTDIPRVPALLEIYGYYPLAILAIGGLVTRRARRTPRWLWFVPVCLAATVVVTGFIRFRAPIDPFLVMLAALALAALVERRPGSADKTRPGRRRAWRAISASGR